MTDESPHVSKLARFGPDDLLDQVALAAALTVSPRTLRRMVARLEIPPGIFVGGRKRWFAGQVRQFLFERAEREAARSAAHRREIRALRASATQGSARS